MSHQRIRYALMDYIRVSISHMQIHIAKSERGLSKLLPFVTCQVFALFLAKIASDIIVEISMREFYAGFFIPGVLVFLFLDGLENDDKGD